MYKTLNISRQSINEAEECFRLLDISAGVITLKEGRDIRCNIPPALGAARKLHPSFMGIIWRFKIRQEC